MDTGHRDDGSPADQGGVRTIGWLGPGVPFPTPARDDAPGWPGADVEDWADDEWTVDVPTWGADPEWVGRPAEWPGPAVDDVMSPDAAQWLTGGEATDLLDQLDGDESEFLPALAAIIPAVISAAPAIISAVQQLTSKPAPRPAPAPPAPPPAAPTQPPAAAAPRPAAPPPRPVRVVVPPRTAPAPSGGAGTDGAATADLLRRLADLLPQVVQVVQAATARESEGVHPHAGEHARAHTGEHAREHTGEHRSTERTAEHASRGGEAAGPAEGEASDGPPTGRGPPRAGPQPEPGTAPEPAPGAQPAPLVATQRRAPTDLVPLPDRSRINVGVSPCPTSLLVSRFGPPRDLVTDECRAITSPSWERRMVTGVVGRSRVRGHHLAVDLFRRAFAALEQADPDLHGRVGSTGMLCVRHVRGRPDVLSNHALGLALDVTIDGTVDLRDDEVQHGLVTLHDVLAPFGIFWGAGLRAEDSIHFEVGAETVHRWLDEGTF